jgi:uncharacterized protein (TIGR01777 family)
MRVLVTGGTGFIGAALVTALLAGGHSVTVWARRPQQAAALWQGRARCVGDLSALGSGDVFDAVINLAGAPVVGPRWSARRQAQLLGSREGVTQALVQWLAATPVKPRVWVQASAIGYYGVRAPSESLGEDSAAGTGFMASLCGRWEAAAQPVAAAGVRLVVLRLGVVLGPGGALAPLLLPIKLGLGARLGSGEQIMSWIHRDDVLRVLALGLSDAAMQGVYNTVAPQTVSQRVFAHTAGQLLRRPIWLAIPAAPVRWLAGEMAQLFVDGQRVIPQRLVRAGFGYHYPTLQAALRALTR